MDSPPPDFPPGYAEEDISDRVIIAASIFIVLEIAAVALRCAARIIYKTKWGTDDLLMAPALVFSLGLFVTGIIAAEIAGVGRHLDVVLTTDSRVFIDWAKCTFALETLYCVSVAFPKLSVLAMYLRFFITRPYRVISYLTGAVIVAAAIAGVITSLSSCRPFSARWDMERLDTSCINVVRFWQGMSVPNIATDLVILILPMPVIWQLKLPKSQKIALTGVLILGSFGIVSSIVRLLITSRVTVLTDATWASADVLTWSIIEVGCYVIASCLPTYRPFFVALMRRLKPNSKITQSYEQPTTNRIVRTLDWELYTETADK